ncbi:hypothetical protein [Clostridium aminobutyricum]|uniref:Pilus assembly protein n=1 Tax=Clostridium aminobutyricum TaxID=33953 RepID=A0A939D8E4_CLOAM|nr:hypothetical protein [Clostridium aminobutyricum]MBN7772673.1 hypothetical protein [Clostridium aminobutyricum]
MFRYTKKGTLTVEASILLPLVILGILTVGYLIKVHCINENVMNTALDETRLLAIESYTDVGKTKIVEFSNKLEERICDENKAINQVQIKDLKYLYSFGNLDKLIYFNVVYNINIGFPINFYGDIPGNETIVCRAFVGSDHYDEKMNAQEMQKEEESELVWIFPNEGKKYHQKNCSYIAVAATQTVLTSGIKRTYQPCKICKPNSLENGSLVYCFKNSGQVYHRGNCYIVDRYVVEIEKSEAIQRHYSACLKCGG